MEDIQEYSCTIVAARYSTVITYTVYTVFAGYSGNK